MPRHSDTDWVINCFVTRMDYRRQGVATRALKAAIMAIEKQGGGWIEVVTMAFPHNDPILAELHRTYRWRSPEVAEYVRERWPTKEIPGIGAVQGCPTSTRTLGHTGKMSMFDAAVTRAVSFGAREATKQPADRDSSRFRVMLDPAGLPLLPVELT